MARVTIEDAKQKISNRFELVVLAAVRAKQISAGSAPLIERNNDRDPVVALREIAEEVVSIETLRESVIHKYQMRQSTENLDLPDESENQDEIAEEMSNFTIEKKDIDFMSDLYSEEESELDE